jgi:hypothetical protein
MNSEYNTLFLNHFHTPKSTQHLIKHTDATGEEIKNHQGNPLLILDKLENSQKAVITLTEHLSTNGEEYFQKLIEKAESKGGKGSIQNKHVKLELEGAKVKILNGVEASYKKESNHIIIAGLPIKREEQHYMLKNKQELQKSLEKAEYAHPAHPFFGKFGIKNKTLEEVCETINKSDTELFIPFTTAYGPRYDKKARGTKESNENIYSLKEKYSAKFIVEQDHHIHLPSGMNGAGLLKEKSMEEKFPLQEIKSSRVIKPRKIDKIRDLWRTGRTYADQLPKYLERKKIWKKIQTPYTKEKFQQYRNKYYKKELEKLKIKKLMKKTQALNH